MGVDESGRRLRGGRGSIDRILTGWSIDSRVWDRLMNHEYDESIGFELKSIGFFVLN